jgi:hypothetical protein
LIVGSYSRIERRAARGGVALGRHPREQLVGDGGERELIGERAGLVGELLGRRVRRHLGDERPRRQLVAHAEAEDLRALRAGRQVRAPGRGREHEDARGREVTVRETLPVRRLHPEGDAVDEARDGIGRERALGLDDRGERAPLDVLHDDEGALGALAVIDDLDDARVAQRRRLLDTALKGTRLDLAEELDDETAREAIVTGLVHARVAARVLEGAHEPVAPGRHRPRKFSRRYHRGAS